MTFIMVKLFVQGDILVKSLPRVFINKRSMFLTSIFGTIYVFFVLLYVNNTKISDLSLTSFLVNAF